MPDYKQIYNQDYFTGKNSFFWRGGYGKYWGLSDIYFNNLYRPFRNFIKKNQCTRILDVGCAYGILLKLFPSSFTKFGIDVSDHAINIAKTQLPQGKFFVCDIEKPFPFKRNYFDIIICNDVIEHLIKPQTALKNIRSVLKPGGLFYLTSPNLNLIRRKFFTYPDRKEHHISLFAFDELSNLLEKMGFTIKKKWTFSNILFYLTYPGNIGIESAFICSY